MLTRNTYTHTRKLTHTHIIRVRARARVWVRAWVPAWVPCVWVGVCVCEGVVGGEGAVWMCACIWRRVEVGGGVGGVWIWVWL